MVKFQAFIDIKITSLFVDLQWPKTPMLTFSEGSTTQLEFVFFWFCRYVYLLVYGCAFGYLSFIVSEKKIM